MFGDLGVDAITGVELMDFLDLTADELQDPRRFSQLQQVISFFKQFPTDTQRFLIKKVTTGKMVDKLKHVLEYTRLLSKKSALENELDAVEKERSAIEASGDPIALQQISFKANDIERMLTGTNDEIRIYE